MFNGIAIDGDRDGQPDGRNQVGFRGVVATIASFHRTRRP